MTALTPAAFALAIKAHRSRLNLSQSQLAAVLGYSVRTVQDWEQERKTPVERNQKTILQMFKRTKLKK